jgi:hypothetical protein
MDSLSKLQFLEHTLKVIHQISFPITVERTHRIQRILEGQGVMMLKKECFINSKTRVKQPLNQ